MKVNYAIGIDLGGSSVKTVAITAQGESLAREIKPFDADANMDWAETIRALVERLKGRFGSERVAIGLAAPGLAADDERSIAYMPGRLQGLEGLDWTDFFGGAEVTPVLNDGHAALLGEAWLGAARGFKNVIMLTLGTGVGGAAMVDGHLLKGHTGKAGHLGHISLDPDGPRDICGSPGSLEMAIGNCSIEERSGGRFATTHELVTAYRRGDEEASKIWLKSVKALACALCSFGNVLDPEAAVIGGGIARAGADLFEPLGGFLASIEWRTKGHQMELRAAELSEYAGAYGAAHHALAGPGR